MNILKKNYLVCFLGVIISIYPPLINWISFGYEGILNYFANDTFYYLTIAKNNEWLPLFSFDGENPTNGFHPLYQIFLKLFFNFDSVSNDFNRGILFVYCVSSFLIAISVFLLLYRLINLGYPSLLSIIAIIPGFFFIFFSDATGPYGSYWSYINGMESSFSILFFSLLFFFTLKKNFFLTNLNLKVCLLSLLIFLIILSRLDDIFIVFSLAILFFVFKKKFRLNYFLLVQFLAITISLLTIYVIINFIYAGSFLPSSGGSKFGISAYYNLMSFANSFIPLGEIFSSNNWQVWQKTTWRSLHLFLPFLLAFYYCLYFFLFQKKNINNKNFSIFLLAMSLYVILKFLYNFLFVFIWHQGHWYFPISIITSNLIFLFFIKEYLGNKNINDVYLNVSKHLSNKIKIFLYFIIIVFILYLLKSCIYDQIVSKISTLRLFSYIIFAISLVSCIIFISLKKSFRINFFPINTILFLIILLHSNSYINLINKSDINNKNKIFYNNHQAINNDLFALQKKINQEIKIVSFDDGIVGYFLNFNVLSGFGFASDKEAIIAKKKG